MKSVKPVVYCIEYFYSKQHCREALKTELLEIAKLSLLEDGCLQYDVLNDVSNQNLFILVLKYETQDAMSAHEKQPYVKDFSENKMNQLCDAVHWNDAVKI